MTLALVRLAMGVSSSSGIAPASDFGSVVSNRRALSDLLAERGYEPDRNFNALYGTFGKERVTIYELDTVRGRARARFGFDWTQTPLATEHGL